MIKLFVKKVAKFLIYIKQPFFKTVPLIYTNTKSTIILTQIIYFLK